MEQLRLLIAILLWTGVCEKGVWSQLTSHHTGPTTTTPGNSTRGRIGHFSPTAPSTSRVPGSSDTPTTPTTPTPTPTPSGDLVEGGSRSTNSLPGTSPLSASSSPAPGVSSSSAWLLPHGMEWVLLGFLVSLVLIALIIAVCLVCTIKERHGSWGGRLRGPATGGEEDGHAILDVTLTTSTPEDVSPPKPVNAAKPLTTPPHRPPGEASNTSHPSPSSPDYRKPKPAPRRGLRRGPEGPPPEEEEGGVVTRGEGQTCRKSVYSVLRQSLADLDAVQACLVDRLEFGQLVDDFKAIPVSIPGLSYDDSVTEENKKKNRFASVVPYDKNRVVLKDGYTEGEATDYVNASYIDGYRTEKAYIAAQGPKDTTVSDFWRMVWQEKVTHVVMLTNLKERGRDKCYQYWPEERGETLTAGPLTITLDTLETRATFLVRRFTLTSTLTTDQKGEARGVIQLHYIAWPDFGVPLTASLVSFWRHVTKQRQEAAAMDCPLVVHCSAGVGRSGTFIGLDIAMQKAVREAKVDLLQLVTSLRHQRVLMVQAAAQFEFLHIALLEGYTSRESIFPVNDMATVFTSPVLLHEVNPRIDLEFRMLTEMKGLAYEAECKVAKQDDNLGKNRNSKLLPADDHIVYLTEYVSGRGDYVNAVYMPTFHEARGSVVTQLPLPETLLDFWRLVYGENITHIVSLASPGEDINKVTESREVTLLHYDGWTGETAGEVDDVMSVVDHLMTLPSSQTYIVQCTDGVRKSGLFCALCDVIGRMTYDEEVDVYMSVRHIQSVAPRAVSSLVQYRYLYQAAQRRGAQLSVYANEV